MQKRDSLSKQEFTELNQCIAANLYTLPFESLKTVHLFYPIEEKKEFDSLLFKAWLTDNHPEIKLVVSKSDLKNHTLQHVEWRPETAFEVNRWNITEPIGGTKVDPLELDMVLIPLLTFDKSGNRVGYGKGFYDRFLKDCRADCLKVGVSFFEPISQTIETDKFDVPLDICVTPEKIWQFRQFLPMLST